MRPRNDKYTVDLTGPFCCKKIQVLDRKKKSIRSNQIENSIKYST